MKNILLFENINSIYDLERYLLSEKIYTKITDSYFNTDNLVPIFGELRNINGNKAKLLLDYMHYIDKKLKNNSATTDNSYHKLPTFLSGIIYITKYFDKIEKYDLDDIMIISHYMSVEDISSYKNSLNIFTKKILSEYKKKEITFTLYDEYNEIVRKLFSEGKTEKEIIEHIRNTTVNDLMKEALIDFQDTIEKGGFVF
jgi:hypothetical protein